MIDTVGHYIKMEVPLQAQTKDRKILTSLQTSVTILSCWAKIKQGDLYCAILAISHYINTRNYFNY